jgi:hypothetical protein
MIEAPETGIDVDDRRVTVDWFVVQGLPSAHEGQGGVVKAAESHENPGADDAIEVG